MNRTDPNDRTTWRRHQLLPHIHPGCCLMHVTTVLLLANALALQLGAWPWLTIPSLAIGLAIGLFMPSRRRPNAPGQVALPPGGGEVTLTGPHATVTRPPVHVRRRWRWWITAVSLDIVFLAVTAAYFALTLYVVISHPHDIADEFTFSWWDIPIWFATVALALGAYRLWGRAHDRATVTVIREPVPCIDGVLASTKETLEAAADKLDDYAARLDAQATALGKQARNDKE